MFDIIFDRLKNKIVTDMDAVDMIVGAYIRNEIDEEEKEMLLDFV